MNRIDTRFEQLKSAGRKALVPFFTAGDPSKEATVPVMHALVEAGADLIELGVAFSDPMADGPVIQRSSERALARGAGLSFVLQAVRDFRANDAATPVVLMGYLNPVEIRGYARFAVEAMDAGVDGVLLVDLPTEEAYDLRAALKGKNIALILLASPTTPDARLDQLCRDAEGYLYYVSYTGVTGADRLESGGASQHLATIRDRAGVPVVAGFGIKDPASAAAMAGSADGVVVGSALVSALTESADIADAVARAAAFLRPLRLAIDGGRDRGDRADRA